MAIICLMYVLNTPEDLGWKSYCADVKVEAKAESKDESSWNDLIYSRYLWLLSFCYMVVFCVKTSAVDWGQMYLMDDLGHSQYVGSAFTSALETGGFIGGVASGYITDWLLSRPHQGPGSPRMPIAFLFTVGVGAGLHGLCFNVHDDTSQLYISSLGCFLGACLYGSISIFGVVAAEAAPTHLSGSAHAIVALAANIGAVISGLPFSYIAKIFNWRAIFFLLEAITISTIVVMVVCRNMAHQIGKQKSM